MSTPEEIKAEYTSSLADLTFNSKPLINVLTMLAEENLPNAKVIVEAIEAHLAKVDTDVKLPILYLIDCIVKNVARTYSQLFAQNIVSTFCSVFKQVDEKTRAEMFKLRQTWNDVFPQKKLYAIDVQINLLDPAWPVTAQRPSNSIHFNPKFLKPPVSTVAKPQTTTETTQILPSAAMPSIDKETLLMQEKLIQKQKELLELQQKKLELEVLQTQVKLQEQLKGTNVPVPAVTKANILLKPEVAKQLVSTSSMKSKPTGIGSTIMNQRMQAVSGNVPRINPVGGPLVSAVKPIRDPRLLRQQKPSANNTTQPNDSSVPLVQKPSILENNKNVTNKVHVKRDPRLANKDSESDKPKTFLKSRQQSPSKPEGELQRSPKSVSRLKLSSDSDKSASTSKSSSTSSLIDSPKKSDRLLKSPTKYKKREKVSSDDFKSKDILIKPLKSSSPTGFKSSKGSKGRNYIKPINKRSASPSPDRVPQDEDLRSLALHEKAPVPSTDSSDNTGTDGNIPAPKGVDIDLRQIPGVIGKKRPSIEASEQSSAKKSKTEMLDELFGNEDTDLRKIPVNDRPPTPPPPIISSSDTKPVATTEPNKEQNSFDAIRAKLANATSRDKIMAKSFHKKKLKGREDQDLRVPKGVSSPDIRNSILISPDDEKKIKSGNLTKEQQAHIWNKIFMSIEKDKLLEAKKKDHSSGELDISLQPISDDEFPEDDAPEALDKDERFQSQNTFHKEENTPYYPRGRRGMPPNWRGAPVWRGRGMMPHPRPPIRPWGPGPKWGNLPPNMPHYPPPEYVDVAVDEEASKSPDINSEQPQNGALPQDEIKTINIDGIPRDIRFYDETAVVFLNWDDPREISFQSGTRRVIFNDTEVYYLAFNDGYKECLVNGKPHKVRLGAPSREIFIDGVPYECFFGGASITVDLDGVKVSVKLDGLVPQVKIGETKRTDLVAGKITLIIDAKVIVPVFLDAKAQRFAVDGETSTLKFVDALKTVLINDIPFTVEFGGLPKPFTIHDKKHFIRFSVLPKGVRPGYVRIKNMEGEVFGSPRDDDNSQEDAAERVDASEPALPVPSRMRRPVGGESPDNRSNSPSFLQNILQPNLSNLDVLSNVLSSSINSTPTQAVGNYQIENPITSETKNEPTAPHQPVLPPPLNINELFQKLVATGFVKTATPQPQPQPPPQQPKPQFERKEPPKPQNGQNSAAIVPKTKKSMIENLRPINFSKPESLRIRQGALYVALYTGNPCSSCGLRFPPEASMQYSQHLDWHFRQNRKGKKNIRVAASRKWYYSLADWKNYEEIEDLEEREKNYFDQQQQAEGVSEESEENVEVPSVPADPNRTDEGCVVCRDKFDQFFNEEKEEWHLRNAIKIDNRTYHPLCYEDHQQSISEVTLDESKIEEVEQPKMIPGLEIVLDDDDEVLPEIVSLDDDESKPESEKAEEEEQPQDDEDDDDDVILNEVAPVKIVVDDDDDDEDGNDADRAPLEPPMKIKKEKHVDDDGFVDVGEGLVRLNKVGQIRIKTEPMDTDDLNASKTDDNQESISILEDADVEMRPEEPMDAAAQDDRSSTMDGNLELDSSVSAPLTAPSIGARIKINISKPLPSAPKERDTESAVGGLALPETVIDPSQPYPPGEEPVAPGLKPGLRDVELRRLPPVERGSELSGLCSIM